MHNFSLKFFILSLFLFFQLSFSAPPFNSVDNSPLIQVNVFFNNYEDVKKIIALGFTPDYSHSGYTTLEVSKEQLELIKSAGFSVYNITEQNSEANRAGRANFPTYQTLISNLMSLVASNSSIAIADTIGFSTTDKKPIIEVTITSSVNSLKPIFRITGATHGNEKVGSEFAYELAKELLENYNTDATCKNIVDNCIIKVVPIMCPDGYIDHSRYLSGQVDPNRQFGWQAGYYNGSDDHSVVTYPFASTELTAYYRSMDSDPWYFCLDYHTGMTAVMAPWFADVAVGSSLMDYSEFKKVGDIYRDNMPSSFFSENGGGKLMFGGYEQSGMPGIQTDWGYSRAGTISINIEVSQSQQQYYPSNYNDILTGNISALKEILTTMQKGIAGRVLDKESGEPVFARVEIINKGFSVLSSPKNGNFFKYIKSPVGTYDVKVTANGYEPKTVTYNANASKFSTKDIELTRDKNRNCAAMSVEYYRSNTRPAQSDIDNILGLSDGIGLTLSSTSGWSGKDALILLSMGNHSKIPNLIGDDITVYALGSDEYKVYGGNDITDMGENSTNLLGTGSGETSFDINTLGLDSVRYVKIVTTEGAAPVIDAIEGWPRDFEVSLNDLKFSKISSQNLKLNINSSICKISISNIINNYSLKIFDLQGRVIKDFSGKSLEKTLTIDLSNIANGAYLFDISFNNINSIKPFILNR